MVALLMVKGQHNFCCFCTLKLVCEDCSKKSFLFLHIVGKCGYIFGVFLRMWQRSIFTKRCSEKTIWPLQSRTAAARITNRWPHTSPALPRVKALLAGIYSMRREDKPQEALLPASAAYLWGNSSYDLEKSKDLKGRHLDLILIVASNLQDASKYSRWELQLFIKQVEGIPETGQFCV
ncbi:hypothetical protein OJAV_G00231470 [Oryzias javanicus]|uniref:Uncharacterized protein n=1 Tax=Oryzias javanicus TaxID=123683 RepID=A0A437BZT3_ORYJA|nr:hypothetical protein OJAV_G00231470 [Oryzias javanicus]